LKGSAPAKRHSSPESSPPAFGQLSPATCICCRLLGEWAKRVAPRQLLRAPDAGHVVKARHGTLQCGAVSFLPQRVRPLTPGPDIVNSNGLLCSSLTVSFEMLWRLWIFGAKPLLTLLERMAGRTGLEPTASAVTVGKSLARAECGYSCGCRRPLDSLGRVGKYLFTDLFTGLR
jgi:hypothetical protein